MRTESMRPPSRCSRTICGCAVGTIKSRVNRARNRLAELMHFTDLEEDLGPDRVTLSVMHAVA